jgi:hypothetical protein
MPMDSEKRRKDEIANEVVREYQDRFNARGNHHTQWKEIAQRMLPQQYKFFDNFGHMSTKGEKRTEYIFDSTAAIALNRFASILDSLLTPRNQKWHRLMPSDPALMKDRASRVWFEDVTTLLFKYRYAPHANFASQNQMNYKSLGAYGSGCVFIDDLDSSLQEVGLRYKSVHLSQAYFKENHQGIVDGVLRYFPMTARQAVQKWGAGTPEKIKSSVESAPEREFFFIHCVKPRSDRDVKRADYRGMPFSSYYVSVECKETLSEGGFRSFPYAVSRYEQVDGDPYGISPAMDVLPAVKTLNEQKKTLLKQGHRTVDPILLVHDDGILDSFSLKPGAINTGGVSADGRPLVHALPVGRVDVGKELMDDERAVINDAFLVTLFQILVETPQMTATEVMERTREKGILLAPTIGRQQSEYLGPLIEREIDILSRQGVLPPMPPALLEAQGEYRVEYDSPLSRAQRAEEASGLMRTLESALNVVNITQNPEPLDHFKWDVIIPELSDIQGVPMKWMRSLEEVASIRDGRAAAQEE